MANTLKKVTADDGITRTWTYVNGLLEREIHPESGTTRYEYDLAGALIKKTANNKVCGYQYVIRQLGKGNA